MEQAYTTTNFLPFIPSPEDAFITSIDAPTLPTCTANSNVEVTLGTLGFNDLTSATINWSVNGVGCFLIYVSGTQNGIVRF